MWIHCGSRWPSDGIAVIRQLNRFSSDHGHFGVIVNHSNFRSNRIDRPLPDVSGGDYMVRKTSSWIGTILFLTSLTAYAGGPPILTTSKVPEYFIVGRAKTLVFVVRGMCCDHGPLDHRNYRVRATAAGQRKIEIPATPTANPGEYAATLTLPAPGDWAITVDFARSEEHTSELQSR